MLFSQKSAGTRSKCITNVYFKIRFIYTLCIEQFLNAKNTLGLTLVDP